jgi:dihydrofolate synthase/folylpolyglutamate synthase
VTYEQTLEYLYEQLPMFHRIGSAAYKADLNNTHAICELLDHPENKFRSVHIAGTNGKGSTSHMLAAILQTAGYKTGLYTSPHLKDFRERIRINRKMIDEENVIRFVELYKNEFEKIKPSFFEWTVGLAFDFFANEIVDIAIIETGLGGRLDSTNVITPLLSVITNISNDHKNLLGDTLEKIATEKAGIIKKNIPVVIGETQKEVEKVFRNKSAETKSEIFFADSIWTLSENSYNESYLSITCSRNKNPEYKNLQLDLTGSYQKKNILTVLESVEHLKKNGFNISEENIFTALTNVKSLTGLQGRWQKIKNNPATFVDVGHNEAGIKEVLEQIKKTPHNHLHFVLGMVSDKDVSSVLTLLPSSATYYFCKPKLPRALDENSLAELASKFNLKGEKYSSVSEALNAAQLNAKENDLVFAGGSTFVVAEII